MADNRAEKFDKDDSARRLSCGTGWRSVMGKLACQRPDQSLWVKGFTVRRNFKGDDAYTSEWFLILRAQVGANDYVKFRRFNNLMSLPFVLLDCLRKESDWREDRFGVSGANLDSL